MYPLPFNCKIIVKCSRLLLKYEQKCAIIVRSQKRHPGVAQFGSALEWGSRGRGFDSRRSDQNRIDESRCGFFQY